MVAEVILDFFAVLKVFFSFSGFVREPMAEERIFSKSSNSPIFAHGCGDRCLGYRFHRTGFPERQPYRWHYPEGLPAEFRRKAYTLKALRTYLHGKQT